jgi:hypothetical protein
MRDLGIFVVILGAVILIFKNQINSIEATLQNTYTGIGIIAVGAIMIFAESKHLKSI